MTKSKFDPQNTPSGHLHHRHSIRLPEYDYSQLGAYFVTIVAWHRECLFGEVINGKNVLSEFGEIVAEKWQWLEMQYDYVELGV